MLRRPRWQTDGRTSAEGHPRVHRRRTAKEDPKIQYTRLVKKTRERVPMKNVRNGRRMGRSGAGKLLGQIRQILAEAAEEGIVSTNVAAMVKLKNEPSTEEAWTFLTLEEQEAVLSGDEIPEWGRDLIARGPRLGRPSRLARAAVPRMVAKGVRHHHQCVGHARVQWASLPMLWSIVGSAIVVSILSWTTRRRGYYG
jgi:hypothetical protein